MAPTSKSTVKGNGAAVSESSGRGGGGGGDDNGNINEKDRKRKKQYKRMTKILASVWQLQDSSVFQGGEDEDAAQGESTNKIHPAAAPCLTRLGIKLDQGGYPVGRQGWEEFAQDLGDVYNLHIIHHTAKADLAMSHLETVKQLLKDPSLVQIATHIDPNAAVAENDTAASSRTKNGIPEASRAASFSSPNHKKRRRTFSESQSPRPQSPCAPISTSMPLSPSPSAIALSSNRKKTKKINPNQELAEREERAMEMLHSFLQERMAAAAAAGGVGLGDESLQIQRSMVASWLEGCSARVTRKRASNTVSGTVAGGGNSISGGGSSKKFDVVFYDSNSRRFRSMLEVGRFFGLVHDGGSVRGSSNEKAKVQRQVSQHTLAEKKRLRRELERLQKAQHRASKALDDFDVGQEQHQSQHQQHQRQLLQHSQNNNTDEDSAEHHQSISSLSEPVKRNNCASARQRDMTGFSNVPSYCVADVLMSWDFLCTFQLALSLSPISLDDFASALTYQPPSHSSMMGSEIQYPPVYMAEAHLALLKFLLQDTYSDDWWWSTLETEESELQQLQQQRHELNQKQRAATAATDISIVGTMTDDKNVNHTAHPHPVINIDLHALLSQEEDPLNTQSWLLELENGTKAGADGIRTSVVLQAVKRALKVCANKWVFAYLRKATENRNRTSKMFLTQAIMFLVMIVRKARPDLLDGSVKRDVVMKATATVIEKAVQQMHLISTSAPTVTLDDAEMDWEVDDYDDESDSDDEENEDMTSKCPLTSSEQQASVIPPRPPPSLTDLFLPPSKPEYNSEYMNSFTWPHILGATAHRILHRKKRLLNETDDCMRSSRELPFLRVASRRERESLTASRILTECSDEVHGQSPTDQAIEFLCSGGDYLSLSTIERLCLLRLLIEAAYDTNRLHSVVDGNIKQRINATKALEVEQRRAKREAKEKSSAAETAAREELALEAKERFFDEKRDEIRKLNERNKELSEDLIDSLTEEDIIDFDEDFKADFEALPKPESFNKAEVKRVVNRMQEEVAFDTDSLCVFSLDELLKREKRELEEKEGELIGIGGEEALMDPSLDRETVRSIERLQRDILKSKEISKRLPEMRDRALDQLRDAIADGTIKVLRSAITAAKKAKLTGPDDETGGVWTVDLLRDAALELENAKQNKRLLDAQKDLVAKMNKCFIRSEAVGHDRFENRFWRFEEDEDGHVWVETECVVLASDDDSLQEPPPIGFISVVRTKDEVSCGAPDMEEDLPALAEEDPAVFRHFCRQEYHSAGFTSTLANNLWGCLATDESIRAVIKTLDSEYRQERELKKLLKESVEQSAAALDEKHEISKEGGRSDVLDEDLLVENIVSDGTVVPDGTEIDSSHIRDSGDEDVWASALAQWKNCPGASSCNVTISTPTALGAYVRISQAVDSSSTKDSFITPAIRYETGRVTGWRLQQGTAKGMLTGSESTTESEAECSKARTTPLIPQWKVTSDRGHSWWLTGNDLIESMKRYEQFRSSQQGSSDYFEADASFLSYRNALGRYCGRATDAHLASSPLALARTMIRREGELYAKLKSQSYENPCLWGGKSSNDSRTLWMESLKDSVVNFGTVQQGLLTLESAFFGLTGEFSDYPSLSHFNDDDVDVERLLSDPASRIDIELETIEKVTGVWNTPISRAVFRHLVQNCSTTTGFLALALDQLCRNTIQYLHTHKLWKRDGPRSRDTCILWSLPPSSSNHKAAKSSLMFYDEEEEEKEEDEQEEVEENWGVPTRRTRVQRKPVNYEEFF